MTSDNGLVEALAVVSNFGLLTATRIQNCDTSAASGMIGVRRPGVGPSEFEFDRFNPDLVDVWIENNGDLRDLKEKVMGAHLALRRPVAGLDPQSRAAAA